MPQYFAEIGKEVRSIAFRPSGEILASGSYDQTVRLWDIRSGEYLKTWQGHNSSFDSVAFSPLGEIFASTGYDETVRLWDIHTGECLQICRVIRVGYGRSPLARTVKYLPVEVLIE